MSFLQVEVRPMELEEQKSFLWFSQYFGIHKPQYKLPFVDFLLDGDVPLYLDSYAITKDGSELAANCSQRHHPDS